MEKGVFWPYEDSKSPDQPTLLHSLIRVLLVRLQNHFITKTCLFKYTENFSTKKLKSSDKKFCFFFVFFFFFHISAQNIDCGYWLEPPRRGGSNEYPQSMFSSRNKKNNVYPCKPVLLYKSGV